MMTVQPLKSAKGAADYYTAAFNYYANDSQAMRWHGKGVERLGLDKNVTKEQVLALLEGKLPDGTVLQDKKGNHRPGFDMTFSAPKSVSILIGLDADKELIAMHDKAVELAIEQIEKEFAQARITKDGKMRFVNTENLVVAAFRQPSSRENDPNTHTHAVVMNMTFDEDGKPRSLASDLHGNQGVIEQLQRSATYGGILYRTHLANMLKEKGYTLMAKPNGLFEIAGMPEEVMKDFSRRREQIEKEKELKGWSGSYGSSAATLNTRNTKEEHDLDKLKKDWHKRATGMGFDGGQFVKEHLTPKPLTRFQQLKSMIFENFHDRKTLERNLSLEAVDVAIETVSQKSSVFDYRQLKEAALRHTLTGKQCISIESIDKAISQQVQSQALYQAQCPVTQKKMLTTPWALTQESESLARIDANKNSVPGITTKSTVQSYQKDFEAKSSFLLTGSQQRAVMQFLTSKDRFNAIQGYAGTGKTTMLKLTKQIAEDSGYSLRGLAVATSAVDELNNKAGINSSVYQVVHRELLQANNNELKNTIFILDEASMLSSIQAHELIKLIEQKGARLVMVGDDAQLPTVKNGRIFGLSQDYGIETAVLDDIIRQKNKNLGDAVSHLVNAEIYDAVGKINEVVTEETHLQRVERIANDWLSVSKEQRENTLIFAPTHKNREEITSILRENLKQEGSLSPNGVMLEKLKSKPIEEIETYFTRYYEEGDVIRFNKQVKRYRIQSGDYLTIGTIGAKELASNTLPLRTSDGKKITFHLNELPEYKKTRAGLNRHIELYKKESKEICQGDKIQWTRNANAKGIINSDRATVEKVLSDSVVIKLSNGESKTFSLDSNELKHLDHGYVFTNYKVQGKDRLYGIGLIESYNKFSATLKNFYVQVSRGIYNMKIVTDNKDNLIKTLSINDDQKKSAIEHVSSKQLHAHQSRFKSNQHAIEIATVIEKKCHKEDEWKKKEQVLADYDYAKQAGKDELISKMAYKIVSDNALQRMADHHIGSGYYVYRQEALPYATKQLKQTLSIEEQQKLVLTEQYVESITAVKQAWKTVANYEEQQLKENDTKLEQLKEQAFKVTAQRNKLAHTVTKDIAAYKPYLAHFSIGEVNRLGVPQYRIGVETDKALKKLESLTTHSEKHEIKISIDKYFKCSNQPEKQELALGIQSQSKGAHPYLINYAKESSQELSEVWFDININAKLQKDADFRSKLPENSQKAFDSMNRYRELGREMSSIGEQYFAAKLDKDSQISDKLGSQLQQYSIERNKIASQALKDESYLPVLAYFKTDKDKLSLQADKHQCRENVLNFKVQSSNFKQKLLLANIISEDIKSHYPYIIESGLDKSKLNQYIRVINRKNTLETLSDPQKADYLKVINYRFTARKTNECWKGIFQDKNKGIEVSKACTNKALELTSLRDSKAKSIATDSKYSTYFEKENISKDKVLTHANNHNSKLRELKELSEIKHALLTELEQKEGRFSRVDARNWHKDWNDLSKHIGQINWAKSSYSQALKDYPIASKEIPEKYLKLLDTYQVSTKNQSNSPSVISDGFKKKIDLSVTVEQLMANPEETYSSIFGDPKKINSREMRYSGGLIVTLKGSSSGLWYDHTEGKGGNPIHAIMREKGIDFKEALTIAAKLAGTENYQLEPTKSSSKTHLVDKDKEKELAIKSARSIWKGAKSLHNTLGEKYMKTHRKISNPCDLNMKFWPKGSKWLSQNEEGVLIEKTNKVPAVIIPIYNHKGHVTAVQRIYLDGKTGGKNTFMDEAKLSKGVVKGSAGIIQKGDKSNRLYIAEGPETAASIASIDKKSTILVSFGLSNISNMGKLVKQLKHSEVIIAGDKDFNAKVDIEKLTNKACDNLKNEGINARVIFPNQIENSPKTDWNDVLVKQGEKELSKQLGVGFDASKKESFTNLGKLDLDSKSGDLTNYNHLNNDLKSHYNPENQFKITASIASKIDALEGKITPSIDKEQSAKQIKIPEKDISLEL